MSILERLTIANLKKNARRTIVTILGVMLASALILAVAGMVTSFQKMMINYAKSETGDYHDMFEAVAVDDIKIITDNNHVESFYYSEPLKESSLDQEVWDMYQVYQHEPYHSKYITPLTELPADAKGTYNVFVRYDHPGEYETYRDNILASLEHDGQQINVRTNGELLRYEAAVMSDAALRTLYSLAIIVISIIVVTSVFVIRNSFSISAAERQRQFGMLASIGATPRQIRSSVLFEGLVIGLIGVPLGLVLGTVAVAVLVLIVNYLLQGSIPISVEFSMPLWIFPLTILLSFVTIFLSSLMPAIRAGRMAPIEAIRGNQEVKIKAKKLHTSKLTAKVFGIGGVIASKNLKRSRKKYRTTVISIVLSIATFIGLASFLSYGKDVIGMQYQNTNIDIVVQGRQQGDDTLQESNTKLYQDLQKQFNLADYAYYMYHSVSHEMRIMTMNQASFEQFAKSVGVHEKDYSHVALLYDQSMELRDDGTLEMVNGVTKVKAGESYKAKIQPDTPQECESEEVIHSNGYHDVVAITVDDACVEKMGAAPFDLDIPITKVIDKQPLGNESFRYPTIYVSENYYQHDAFKYNYGYYSTLYIANVEDTTPIIGYLNRQIGDNSDYFVSNVKENNAQMRRMYLLICIFLYGFIIVVMLIGVTNIFNTITTNIALRAKEFATLKSIGMTKSEFNHMIRLESLMYASKALLIGLPLGLLLSFGFYQSIANSVDFGWSIPWVAILISVVAVGLLISAIMAYSVRQVEKQNIIETIRQDNI